VGLQDKGPSAERAIELGRGPSERSAPPRSRWAADDTIPALSRRVLELETEVASLQAAIDEERRRLATYAESDETLRQAVRDAYVMAEEIRSRAEADANALLEHVVEERRALLSEVGRLREERDQLEDEIASLRRGAIALVSSPLRYEEPRATVDLGNAVAQEMRSLLEELLDEFRAERSPLVPPPGALLTATVTKALPPQVAEVEMSPAPVEQTEPIVDEYVVELRPPEASLSQIETEELLADTLDSEMATAPIEAEPIVDEYVVESRPPEPLPPIETEELLADTPAALDSEMATAPIEAEPIVDEYVVDPLPPAPPPPIETGEQLPGPLPPVPIEIEMTVGPVEQAEPIVDESVVEPVLPEPPPVADAKIEALWDAVPPGTSEVEQLPAPSIAEELVAEMHAPAVPEAPPEAPEVSAPQPIAGSEAPAPAPVGPEATVAEQRAVRQIQIVISPVRSFPHLLEIQQRIESLSSVRTLQLRDFRNGVATYAAGVIEAMSALEFGAVVQMLENLRLRLEAAGETSVELRVEDPPPSA
jgi:hypothetical protein